MARVEKSVLLNTSFQYENVSLPGKPPQLVRTASAVYLDGLWDEEKQEWAFSKTRISTLNDLVPGDTSQIGALVGFELAEVSKTVSTLLAWAADEQPAAVPELQAVEKLNAARLVNVETQKALDEALLSLAQKEAELAALPERPLLNALTFGLMGN